MPYLAGLLGMYCLKLQRPLKGTRHSSTVTSRPGLYIRGRRSTHLSQIFRIAASLSSLQLVLVLCRSCVSVVKPDDPCHDFKGLQRHCSTKNGSPCVCIPQAHCDLVVVGRCDRHWPAIADQCRPLSPPLSMTPHTLFSPLNLSCQPVSLEFPEGQKAQKLTLCCPHANRKIVLAQGSSSSLALQVLSLVPG